MPLKELAARRNLLHKKSDPQTIVKHALGDLALGNTAVVSSFGAESVALLHMVAQVDPATPILFIDTELLFDQTLQYQRQVADHLGLTDVRVISPSRESLLVHDVDGLLQRDFPDQCCDLRKTKPLEVALERFDSWITGRKRYQGGRRAQLPIYEKADHRIKVNPLVDWDARKTSVYIDAHGLPRHPLVAQGFPSIGCRPCTTRVEDDEAPRAGRWRGLGKTECGIHL